LHDSGADISFAAVAHHASVSRQWLYKNADLRAEIEKLRGRQTGVRRVPSAQRASDASLRQRNALLLEENKRLRRHVMDLKEELAQLHGERRVNALMRVTHRTGGA
jgi:predicted RNase H-like nuclease (RuvC/YqgF family)